MNFNEKKNNYRFILFFAGMNAVNIQKKNYLNAPRNSTQVHKREARGSCRPTKKIHAPAVEMKILLVLSSYRPSFDGGMRVWSL